MKKEDSVTRVSHARFQGRILRAPPWFSVNSVLKIFLAVKTQADFPGGHRVSGNFRQ